MLLGKPHCSVGLMLTLAVVMGAAGLPALAQQIAGVLDSPDAKISIDGQTLPPASSKPWWPPRVVPPKGAPNVLLIITDDQCYGVASAFGGVIPTPALDRLSEAGLRYTQFHSTELCSPTRAALITGRNHHSSGFGWVSELSTGYPGYDSVILKDKVTVGTILKAHGYATSWFGKNHNTPLFSG